MDNWFEIKDFPNYYINQNRQIKHFDRIYKYSPVVTLRNKKKQFTIRRNRLLYLTVAGISPTDGRYIDVDIIEEKGKLEAINRTERRTILAQEKHKRSIRTKDEAVKELDNTIEFCSAIKSAFKGDYDRLLYLLDERKEKLTKYLQQKGVIKDLAEDISISTIEWYFDALTVRRCTATSFDYIKKRALGIYKGYKAKFVQFKQKEQKNLVV